MHLPGWQRIQLSQLQQSRRAPQGCGNNILLDGIVLYQDIKRKVLGSDKRYVRQAYIITESRQRKTQEAAVMMFCFKAWSVCMLLMYRVMVVGKQVHEFLGCASEHQEYNQKETQNNIYTFLKQRYFVEQVTKVGEYCNNIAFAKCNIIAVALRDVAAA
jgi:ABC-type dipeptide/oligopeptide/nickel transport system ATPase component